MYEMNACLYYIVEVLCSIDRANRLTNQKPSVLCVCVFVASIIYSEYVVNNLVTYKKMRNVNTSEQVNNFFVWGPGSRAPLKKKMLAS